MPIFDPHHVARTALASHLLAGLLLWDELVQQRAVNREQQLQQEA